MPPNYRQLVNGGTYPNNAGRRAQRNTTHFNDVRQHHPWRDVALYIRQALDRQWTLPFLGGAGMTPSDGDKVESWDGIVQRRR